jgi:hypothetical protein
MLKRIVLDVAIVLGLVALVGGYLLVQVMVEDHQLTRAGATNWETVIRQQQHAQQPQPSESTTSTTLPKGH